MSVPSKYHRSKGIRMLAVRNLFLFVVAFGMAICLTSRANAEFIGTVTGAGSGITTSTAGGSGPVSSVQLSWNISQIASGTLSGYWHYSYTFTSPNRGYLDSLIIEVSSNVSSGDIQNFTSSQPSGNQGVGTYSSSSMPSALHGISIHAGPGITNTISFDIDRAPTWGDFFASANGADGPITMWNSGFLRNDDPVDGNNNPLFQLSSYPTAGQLVDNSFYHGHILRPDTMFGTSGASPTMPAPPTLVLAASGGVFTFGAYLLRLRRRFAKV